MSDALVNGRRIRVLTIVDDFSRESVYIGVGSHFRGIQVAQTLASVARRRSVPKKIRVDNSPEFTSVALDQWAYWNEVQLVFSRPATPTDNAHIESFNARLRQECLNAHWFESIEEARSTIRTWQHQYNEEHPHSALGYLTHHSGAALTAVPLFFLLCRALLAKRIDQLLANDIRRGHNSHRQGDLHRAVAAAEVQGS